MILTLKIQKHLGGYDEEFQDCIRIIEIDEDSDLETLHLAIQEAVDFDDDHLYAYSHENEHPYALNVNT